MSLRSRGFYHRGGARAACAGRGRAGPVRSGRRPVSDLDRQQTDEALQRALPHLYKQAGPTGRQPGPSPAELEVRFNLCSRILIGDV